MPLITAADLDFAFQDLGDLVSYGTGPTQSCHGDLKREMVHEPIGDGGMRVHTLITLAIRDGALTGLAMDAPITVGGAAFLIRHAGVSLNDGTRILTLVEA